MLKPIITPRLTRLAFIFLIPLFVGFVSAQPHDAIALAPAMNCMLKESRSQHFADLTLLPFLLAASGYQPGTFVEAGALDGLKFSNTLALERCLGWTGLLVEASPTNFARLQKANRKAHAEHAAICPAGESLRFADGLGKGRGGEQAHSIDTYATRPHLQSAVTTVPCQPLGALLGTHNLSRVHLLVLDVEGSEWTAIQTVDVSVFSIILVELDGKNKTKDSKVHDYILNQGLVFARYMPSTPNRLYMQKWLATTRCGAFCWVAHDSSGKERFFHAK